jgi:hypothetical protein
MTAELCCSDLEYHLNSGCEHHGTGHDCGDRVITRTNRGFGLPIHDGGSSYIEIWFCPWCGTAITPTEAEHG